MITHTHTHTHVVADDQLTVAASFLCFLCCDVTSVVADDQLTVAALCLCFLCCDVTSVVAEYHQRSNYLGIIRPLEEWDKPWPEGGVRFVDTHNNSVSDDVLEEGLWVKHNPNNQNKKQNCVQVSEAELLTTTTTNNCVHVSETQPEQLAKKQNNDNNNNKKGTVLR